LSLYGRIRQVIPKENVFLYLGFTYFPGLNPEQWFAWFIRRVFQAKLHENAEQISAQRIISAISSDFVTVNERNLKKKLSAALSEVGVFLGLDRAYVYLSDIKKDRHQCHLV
jgi:hypothetical protein